MDFKVLNIAQPNAHHIFHNGKNVENRNMPSAFRGTIAIYASGTHKKDRFEDQELKPKTKREDCTFGAIIGVVDMVACIEDGEETAKTRKWFNGDFGYVFERPTLLKQPLVVRPPHGAIVWWTLKGKQTNRLKRLLPISRKIVSLRNESRKESLFYPSETLAKLIGSRGIKEGKIFEVFYRYLADERLLTGKNNCGLVKANSELKKIFGKSRLTHLELTHFIKDNFRQGK